MLVLSPVKGEPLQVATASREDVDHLNVVNRDFWALSTFLMSLSHSYFFPDFISFIKLRNDGQKISVL